MTRWTIVALLLLNVALAGTLIPWLLASDAARPTTHEVAELKDQLESGLKARRPEDFRFIRHVVTLVDQGRLPIELVKSTFHWVRKHRGHKTNLVPYFEAALRHRAERAGYRI